MLTNSIYQEEHIPTQFERFWRSFKNNSLAMFGLWCLSLMLIITLIAPWITPHNPIVPSGHLLLPPSWDPTGSIDYFLGTDDLGRDILSRLIAGSRHSFGYAILVTFVALCIGSFIGVLAGMTSGLLSSTLNHLLDTVMSIPSLLLAVVFVAFLGPGEMNVLLSIGLALTPRFIRGLYTAISTEMAKDYIMAARLDGARDIYLLINSILPNILTVIALETTLALTIAILDITALGFLGLGAQAPTTEWGAMLGKSVELLYLAPWTVLLPGLMIMFTIVVVNLVGEGTRQALNAGIE
jgi:cationic peptide transport system permease protein